MKRKSNSTPDASDEEEYKDMLPVSVKQEMMGVESIKGISSSTSFDDGEIDQKLASIHIPKAEETIKGKSSFTLFGSEITFPDPKGIKEESSFTSFGSEENISHSTFIKPKAEPKEEKTSSAFFDSEGKFSDSTSFESEAESLEGKPSSTYSGSGGKIPGSNFIGSKSVESIKGKSSSTFFGPEGKGPDVAFSEPKGVESMKHKSSPSSSGSYDVVMDFDNTQYMKKGLKLGERLHELLKSFEIYMSEPDNIDVLEVGVTGKVFIPVFSNGFASSESCLRNLASMVDCRNYSDTNHIIPIYFGVEPSDVRLDTPLYQQDLDKLRRYVDDMVVNRWIEALIDVTNISGRFIVPETAG